MLKLFLHHVHRKVGFELENTPRFPWLNVILPSSQEQEIGEQSDSR